MPRAPSWCPRRRSECICVGVYCYYYYIIINWVNPEDATFTVLVPAETKWVYIVIITIVLLLLLLVLFSGEPRGHQVSVYCQFRSIIIMSDYWYLVIRRHLHSGSARGDKVSVYCYYYTIIITFIISFILGWTPRTPSECILSISLYYHYEWLLVFSD